MKGKINLLLILLMLFSFVNTNAQEKKHIKLRTGTLVGRITNAKDGKAMPMVNAYISGTSMGGATNKYGYYRIKRIPPGEYDFIFSAIGFKVKIARIKIQAGMEFVFDVKLEPTTIDIENVEVTAMSPTEWHKNYKIFETEFLGNSRYFDQCEIVNKEVIDFYRDEEEDRLVATTDSIIIVNNYALGYKLEIFLKKFELSFKTGGYSYDFYPRFTDMETDDILQILKWKKNRMEIYKGSVKHFLSDLAVGILDERVFQIEIYDCNKMVKYNEKLENLVNQKQPDKIEYVEDLNIQTKDSTVFVMPFNENRCLYVKTILEGNHKASVIEPMSNALIFDVLGNIHNPGLMMLHGDWTQEKISTMLPRNFMSKF